MKITDFKSLQNVKDLESLIRYVNIDVNLILSTINGEIDLLDNCSTVLVPVSFPKANITYPFTHGLNRIPAGYLSAGISSNAVLFNGNTPNNINQIFIQSSAANVTGKVLVF